MTPRPAARVGSFPFAWNQVRARLADDAPLIFAIWIGTAAVLILIARATLFGPPVYEWSDFAVNALQIDRAKQLAELLGNYSRFEFHHPGPAFFYVYAISETVLFDGLHLVASPMQAHILGGIFLQAGFFTMAIAAVSSMDFVRDRIAFTLAGLAVGAVVFTFAQQPAVNIWPPYVLVMPFAAFLAASAAVASGRTGFLPAAALAGVFLVHGHVAQPLFVVPIAGIAYLSLLLHGGPRRWRVHIIAAAILAIGILPIAIDALTAETSNLALILATRHGKPHSVVQGLAYLLGFLQFPTWVTPPMSLSLRAVLLAVWPQVLLLLAAIGLPAALLLRGRRPRFPLSGVAALYVLGAIAALLALIWAMVQFGEPYAFNAFFVFGLLFVALLPACALVPQSGRVVAAVALVAAVVVAVLGPMPASLIQDPTGDAIHAAVAQYLVDHHPEGPVLVESSRWDLQMPAVLDLERAGVIALVPPVHPVMAGPNHLYPSARWPLGSVVGTLTVTQDSAIHLTPGPPP